MACLLGGRPIQTLLLDLDDCLYRVERAPALVRANIEHYMEHALAIPAPTVPDLCLHFYTHHGTTYAGLVASGDHGSPRSTPALAADAWHAHVHGTLPYEDLFPAPDTTLRAILASLPQRLFIFTNGDEAHAETCLARLGIRDLLEGVICFESIMRDAAAAGLTDGRRPVVCKPQATAFQLALAAAGCAGADPATVAFFDDSLRNVDAGAGAGLFSVLVGRVGVPGTKAAAQIASMHDLPRVMPGLWGKGGVPPTLLAALPAPLLEAERAAAVADAADTAAGVPSYSAVRNAAVSADGAAAAAAAHHGPASPRAAAAAEKAAAAAGGWGTEEEK